MVVFCDEVIQEILKAGSDQEVEEIIQQSIRRFCVTGTRNPFVFFINMIVSLQVAKVNVKTLKEVSNVKYAIEIFRRHQHSNQSIFF